VLPLFAATIFLSAALLFALQPMVAKLVLPQLGGSPAVWNTCMVFFQAALLAGYAYAHWSTRWLGIRRQAMMHIPVLLVPLVVLPIALRAGEPPTAASPIPWLLLSLIVAVGLPFFVVSTSGPLLQRWFGITGHRTATDPYFLYAASNAGSLLALLAYPFALEPLLTLRQQSLAWTAGYLALILLTIGCAVVVLARGRRRAGGPSADAPPPPPVGGHAATAAPWTPVLWVLLAFIPSSLMLGVTQYISTDIAAVPLLWVVPLALYLLTFILAFSTRRIASAPLLSRASAIIVAALVVMLVVPPDYRLPAWATFALHLTALFIGALYCHTRLADLRPPVEGLTGFYLLVAVGGVLGGAFNGLLAPVVFNDVIEYSIVLVLLCFARLPARSGRLARLPRVPGLIVDISTPVFLTILIYILHSLSGRIENLARPEFASGIAIAVTAGLPAILLFLLSPRIFAFALGAAAMLTIAHVKDAAEGRLLHQQRTFFGVYRVYHDPSPHDPARAMTTLVHGTTIHGAQWTDPARRSTPLSYYHPDGPIGDVFRLFGEDPRLDHIGLVGLGSGALAAYGREGRIMTFHEIDPEMVRIAADPRLFTYISDSKSEIRYVLGDGRRTLTQVPDGAYGLLVLDAFSSDAIPVHMATLEAIDLYTRKITADGLIAFHISNKYLHLAPVIARIADELGLAARHRSDDLSEEQQTATGRYGSEWVVLARSREHLGPLLANPRWLPLETPRRAPLWTDSYSNLISVYGVQNP
jgi:hypothetical protein